MTTDCRLKRQQLRTRPNVRDWAWMDGLMPVTDDLVKVRYEVIGWILRIDLDKQSKRQ